MSALLFSALTPNEEKYEVHIQRCMEKFDLLFPIFYSTIVRVFSFDSPQYDFESLKTCFSKMILFHDLGKLTEKWQENVGTNKKLPSHAPIGAGFLYKKFKNENVDDNLKNAVVFAVAIHHTDSGLLGDNIERPDVQAIIDGIVDYDENIKWHKEIDKLDKKHFPDEAKSFKVTDLKEMARGLRVWARGCGLLEQHQRRLQASLAHHILKLCDISAATERKEYQKKDEQDYYGGWLMVDEIKKYVESITQRYPHE
ncbi:CRISPR-associated endonuclease Cas3'' [Caldisericum sp.]|uniref:CRISPR-associated endonuclease Cas3'' n=1 Tax=Caldisericum sp. TaxID=2499687 RepID=UPI003D0D1CCE